jgi:hypothetical protein
VSATRTFTFRANYTGIAQIIVWLEGPDSGATVTAEADSLSFLRVPQ